MTKEHINTFLVLAARAQKAGLIELNEMAAVAQAVEAAQKELNPQPVAQPKGNAHPDGSTSKPIEKRFKRASK
jgi:hypothetical protein